MFAFFGMPGYIELLIIGTVFVVPVIVVAIVISTNRSQQQFMKCPKCGLMSPPSNFCPHCGAQSTKED